MRGESHPPGRNERPDEFEVGWSDAKAYGCRQDTDGQQQQQRIVADETKPQAAVKGGESPHVDQTKYV